MNNQCYNCRKTFEKLLRCSRCKNAEQCTANCQKDHWNIHKKLCKNPNSTNVRVQQPIKEDIVHKSYNHFDFLTQLGQGNFTETWLAQDLKSKQLSCIKILNKDRIGRNGKEDDQHMELFALKKLREVEGVVKLRSQFEDDFNWYIETDFHHIELFDRASMVGFCEDVAKFQFAQLCYIVRNLHKHGIVHRDIKPENVLQNEHFRLKIIDFGSSRDVIENRMSAGNGRKDHKFMHYVGTPNYMPYECIHETSSDKPCDIFALGATLYWLQTGYPMQQDISEQFIFKKIEKQDQRIQEGTELDRNKKAKDLINQCNAVQPGDRPTIAQLIDHQFLEDINHSSDMLTNHIEYKRPFDSLQYICLYKIRDKIMCKDTNYSTLNVNDLATEENKAKMFNKAKLNQDPTRNSVGIADIHRLQEIKEEQMKLNDFNKEYCREAIKFFDNLKEEYNDSDGDQSNTIKKDLAIYHRIKFVKMYNKRQENEEQVKEMANSNNNEEFKQDPDQITDENNNGENEKNVKHKDENNNDDISSEKSAVSEEIEIPRQN